MPTAGNWRSQEGPPLTLPTSHPTRLRRPARRPGENLRLSVKTVSRPENTSGFVLLPRRRVVERTRA